MIHLQHLLLSLFLLCHVARAADGDPGVYPGGPGRSHTGWISLPSVAGARYDATSLVVSQYAVDGRLKSVRANVNATLPFYITDTFDATKVKRIVLQLSGQNRDSWNQWLVSGAGRGGGGMVADARLLS